MDSIAKLDRYEHLAASANNAVAIFSSHRPLILELIALDDERANLTEIRASLDERGFSFIGVIGMLDSAPRVALAEEIDADAMETLGAAYSRLVEERIKDEVRNLAPAASLRLLERLWSQNDAQA